MQRRSPSASPRSDLYEEITTRIIAELEEGRVPWIQPWSSDGVAALDMPRNATTERRYSGINILILWTEVVTDGFASQRWLTFKQALSLGGCVRKGERGTTVVYADRFVPDGERRRAESTGDTPQGVPFLKRFTVFNVAQCDGLPTELTAEEPPVAEGLILQEVEALIAASGATVRLGGSKAFYGPDLDVVQVPRPECFAQPIDWHRTALHELGHWTRAKHRLARDQSGGFGSESYAREELVAEMSAAFTCATLGVVPTVRHADYIASWLELWRGEHNSSNHELAIM